MGTDRAQEGAFEREAGPLRHLLSHDPGAQNGRRSRRLLVLLADPKCRRNRDGPPVPDGCGPQRELPGPDVHCTHVCKRRPLPQRQMSLVAAPRLRARKFWLHGHSAAIKGLWRAALRMCTPPPWLTRMVDWCATPRPRACVVTRWLPAPHSALL